MNLQTNADKSFSYIQGVIDALTAGNVEVRNIARGELKALDKFMTELCERVAQLEAERDKPEDPDTVGINTYV
jgi:hypothetical protein